jgi:hypothetical protein
MEESLKIETTDISHTPEMVKINSEGIKLINRKKIKIKQNAPDWKHSAKSGASEQEKFLYTERRSHSDLLENTTTLDNEWISYQQKECESWSMNEEFIVLLQKEIKRLQNITNDLSYQLIMNGHTPQIKESEREPIDLSINPLRRREHKSKMSDNKMIPSKILNRSQTNDCCENYSNSSTQAEVTRPSSGFRIRDQNGAKNAKSEVIYIQSEKAETADQGCSKVDKYNKEKDFVK